MKELTEQMILNTLQRSSSTGIIFLEGMKYLCIALIIASIILIFIKKFRFYGVFVLVFTIPFIFICSNGTKEYDFIKYATENHSWVVTTDIIVEKDTNSRTSKKGKTKNNYYLHLKEYGEVSVSASDYLNNKINDSVYIILLINENGEKQLLSDVYSTKDYVYKGELYYDTTNK